MTLPTRLVNDGWWLCVPLTPPPRRQAAPAPTRDVLMTLTSFITFVPSPRRHALPLRLLLTAGLTAFADWLFYGRSVGISLAIFLAALVGAAMIARRPRPGRSTALVAAVLLVATMLPLIETVNAVTVLCGVLGAATVVSLLANPFFRRQGNTFEGTFNSIFQSIETLLLVGPFRLIPDLVRYRPGRLDMRPVGALAIPLLLGGIFLKLFADANPLIDDWLSTIDLGWLLAQVSLERLLFWAALLSVSWPFVAARWHRRRQRAAATLPQAAPRGFVADVLFGPIAILQSLVLFNLMFAVQTGLDVAYLWGGVTLPHHLTYAAYAHRGAYPLILTALLAAGFILIATRRPPARHGGLIRGLIFAWTAQNVMLVISSMLRLDLYIQVYSLTYWRIAAFVWMLLVAIGLVLIVVRMALGFSNRWLVLANLTALLLTLYACAFINMPALIANYNLAHCREMSGSGPTLDTSYLTSLGPQALPALERYMARTGASAAGSLGDARDQLVATLQSEVGSWRSWSFRAWRLQRRLARAGALPPVADGIAIQQTPGRG